MTIKYGLYSPLALFEIMFKNSKEVLPVIHCNILCL